jgi:hypothetical protein
MCAGPVESGSRERLTYYLVGSAPPFPHRGWIERFKETHAAGSLWAAGEASSGTAVPLEAAGIVVVLRALHAGRPLRSSPAEDSAERRRRTCG